MDTITKEQRSALMSRIRSTGNRSTELRLRMGLVRNSVAGWTLHPRNVAGRPDFWFGQTRVAVFVDGCFWHGCQRPQCRRSPKQNRAYWKEKIARNVHRSRLVTRQLRRDLCIVLRFWEHDLQTAKGVHSAIKEIIYGIQRHASG